MPSFKLKSSWVTILQGVEFSIFPLILASALQQCSATALPVIIIIKPINSDVRHCEVTSPVAIDRFSMSFNYALMFVFI